MTKPEKRPEKTDRLTMIQAINRALLEEMERDDRVMVLGEDVGRDGGIFRATDGLMDRFGEERVVDTPVSETGILGTSVGLAVGGMIPVPEIQFQAFSYYGFAQIENHVARVRWRSRGRFTCPMTIRMPYGAGIHALELHSESREAYFVHTPGLRVVMPRSPRKAYSLLKASIRHPDPVIFLEPAALYRKLREDVPPDLPPESLDRAEVLREGDDLTLVSYGHMMQRTIAAAEKLAQEGVEADVIDLQSVAPLDSDTIVKSVKKTGRAVVVNEAPRTLGLASEIVARIHDEALAHLEAPVARVTGYDVHVPLYAREQAYMPDEQQILEAARETLAY